MIGTLLAITALSSNYWLTLAARFFAGVSAGLAWSLLAGYARRMVPVHQQGKALAVAMVGTPIALSLGVPLGTWLGTAIGWRNAFAVMSALTLVLIVWVLAKMPDYPGQAGHERLPLRRVFTTPGVRPVLGVVITWMLAHNILYTYVAPFVAQARECSTTSSSPSKRSGFRCWRSAVAATAVWVNMKTRWPAATRIMSPARCFPIVATGCRKNAQAR